MTKAKKAAFLGVFFALGMVLNYLESILAPVAALPPGIRLGLSNIVSMICLFSFGWRWGIAAALLKSSFVLVTRNPVAFAMSLAGGFSSVTLMACLIKIKPNVSLTILSVSGAVMHNAAQLVISYYITSTPFLVYYLPLLTIGGIAAGTVTSVILRVLFPYLGNALPEMSKTHSKELPESEKEGENIE